MKPLAVFVLIVVAPLTYSGSVHSHAQRLIDENFTCPTVLVECPEKQSGNLRFKANVAQGVPAVKFSFKWRVSGGNIVSGQGTEAITVKSKKYKGERITATVEILPGPKDCNNRASCSGIITGK